MGARSNRTGTRAQNRSMGPLVFLRSKEYSNKILGTPEVVDQAGSQAPIGLEAPAALVLELVLQA